jgi:Ca2+/Na+ antiporter
MISIIIGVLLDIVGVASFISTGSTHNAALIPCIIGMIIFVCGILATKQKFLKHAMHAGAVVALFGLIMGLARLIEAFGDASVLKLAPTLSLIILCGLYLGFCIKSFIEARQARQRAQG